MRLIYLIGPPGVGKTTLVAAVTARWAGTPVWEEFPVKHLAWPAALVLGWPRAEFGGTDAWALNAGPKAFTWLQRGPAPLVLGEGDRFSVAKWLLALRAEVIYLWAHSAVLFERRAGRTQDASWVRGRETKCRHLAAAVGASLWDAGGPVSDLQARLEDRIAQRA